MLDGLAVSGRLRLDVTDDDSIAEALSRADDLDAVVDNAAVAGNGPLGSVPLDRMAAMLDTNAVGPLRLFDGSCPRGGNEEAVWSST